MIVKVKKYLFVGAKEDIDAFFSRAQKKGCIEFISKGKKRTVDIPDSIRKIFQAVKILRKLPILPPLANREGKDWQAIAEEVIETKKELESGLEDKRALLKEIARIKPIGDFSPEEIRSLERESKKNIQFFCRKKVQTTTAPQEEGLVHINSAYDLDYFMSVSDKIERFPNMIEMHIEKGLEELKQEYHQLEDRIKKAENRLSELATYLGELKEFCTKELDKYHLSFAIEQSESYLEGSLFAIEAWVPSSRLKTLFPLLRGLSVHVEEIAIEEKETVPTYMENKSYGAVGEDLVHVYDTPATSDKDPSSWVFWSFIVFFAMIISDAGYGFFYLLLSLFLRRKFRSVKGTFSRFLTLMTTISCSCILWGILAGSYFGINIAPDNPINKISFIHYLAEKRAEYHLERKGATYQDIAKKFPAVQKAENGKQFLELAVTREGSEVRYSVLDDFRDNIFLEIALLVGIIHISLSLLRHFFRHFAGIGWVLTAIGGYLYFPNTLQATSIFHFVGWISPSTAEVVGGQLLLIGIGIAIGLALIQHRWHGLMELAKPIELFADILSYLRIYALALAGMILAGTFNNLAHLAGPIFGFFILLGGHGTNIVVCVMGGTIHGLRLNFIEWYHHSFEGGGKLFNPLKLLKL